MHAFAGQHNAFGKRERCALVPAPIWDHIENCLALSDLAEAETLAIAGHEKLSEIAVLEMGNHRIHPPSGEARIQRIIAEDIEHARRCGNHRRSAELQAVLKHFCVRHGPV